MTKGNSKAKQRRRVRHGEKALNGATANKMMGAVVRHNYGGGKADHYRNPDDRNLDA